MGFTRLSTTISALRAVRLLNDIFSRVEAAAAQLGSVWKVRQRRFIANLSLLLPPPSLWALRTSQMPMTNSIICI